MSTTNPLISIILPTFNGKAAWLWEAVDSVINQTYSNRELIVINDASTNDIEKVILHYVDTDNRILYVKNEENMQLTRSLNKWIELSKWKYIARIDDDDIWCDYEKLAKQVNFMEENPEYGLCGTWIILIDENWKEFDKILNREGDTTIRKYISGSNQFAHSSVIIRKSILDKVWYYIDSDVTKHTEDYDLWLRVGKKSKFDNLQEYCVKYRERRWSISWQKRFKQLSNALRVYLQYRNDYPHTFSWIIKHLINIFMPKQITNLLVKANKKLR